MSTTIKRYNAKVFNLAQLKLLKLEAVEKASLIFIMLYRMKFPLIWLLFKF